MGNVLNALPKSQQARAKADMQGSWMAATRAEAYAAFDRFVSIYAAKYPKATETLKKDRESLLAFYEFPAKLCPPLRCRFTSGGRRHASHSQQLLIVTQPLSTSSPMVVHGYSIGLVSSPSFDPAGRQYSMDASSIGHQPSSTGTLVAFEIPATPPSGVD